jgi:Fe-S-cluster containining protein
MRNFPCDKCNAKCCKEEYIDKSFGFPYKFSEGYCEKLDRTIMECTVYDERPLVCNTIKLWEYMKNNGTFLGSFIDFLESHKCKKYDY